jgi:hypothetical protein
MFGLKLINIKAKHIKNGDQILFNNDVFPVNNFIKSKNGYVLIIDRSKVVKEKVPHIKHTISYSEAEKNLSIIRNKNLFDYIFGL